MDPYGSPDGMDAMDTMGTSMAEARARRGIGPPEEHFEFAGARYGRMNSGDAMRRRGADGGSPGRIEED